MEDRADDNRLGRYLAARRAIVTPEQVGLPSGPRRRVAGLRREEVAILAGISADYYLRLERGRDRNPSHQVVDALARVLDLDDVERQYLADLAAPRSRRRGPAGPSGSRTDCATCSRRWTCPPSSRAAPSTSSRPTRWRRHCHHG